MFSIVVLPKSERGPDGERLGRITVGDFSERFGCYGSAAQICRMDSTWRAKLAAITEGALAVALVHDPRFAWVVFREGDDCFIQQIGSLTRKFGKLLPRSVPTARRPISQWSCSVLAIQEFLARPM